MTKKIFIIEDDLGILEALIIILAEEYEVQSTTDGSMAVELITKFKPDIVLLDVLMPGINGCDICKTLKAESRTANIIVIIMSANSQVRGRIKECGANDFIEKPFEVEELLDKLNSAKNS